MPFEPIKFAVRTPSVEPLRYCIRDSKGRKTLCIHVRPELIGQVRGDVLSVRLELGTGKDAKKALLRAYASKNADTGCRNLTGKGDEGGSRMACWPLVPELSAIFPELNGVHSLKVAEVNTTGIVFHLPAAV